MLAATIFISLFVLLLMSVPIGICLWVISRIVVKQRLVARSGVYQARRGFEAKRVI